MAGVTGKTELAKQVARYMHKDIKKVCSLALDTHTSIHLVGFVGPGHLIQRRRQLTLTWCVCFLVAGFHSHGHV